MLCFWNSSLFVILMSYIFRWALLRKSRITCFLAACHRCILCCASWVYVFVSSFLQHRDYETALPAHDSFRTCLCSSVLTLYLDIFHLYCLLRVSDFMSGNAYASLPTAHFPGCARRIQRPGPDLRILCVHRGRHLHTDGSVHEKACTHPTFACVVRSHSFFTARSPQ